jgi:hypothetical protein
VAACLLAILALPALLRADLRLADPTSAAPIRTVMDAMEKAVLAGDQPGYLAHVATDDPIFHKEQENWAKDFEHHVPAAFSLIVEDDPESPDDDPVYTDTEARFKLTMAWTFGEMAEERTRGNQRKVTYPVRFTKAEDGWKYAGEAWEVMERPGVEGGGGTRVLFFKGQERQAETIADTLPEIRPHVDRGFEVKIDRVQEVKVYRSMRHLQASIYLSYVDPLGGWNEPGESIKVLAAAVSGPEGARVVLSHEYGHVCTFEFGEHASDMPWWVAEGVAELAAEKYAGDDTETLDHLVRTWARTGKLAAWEDMTDFRKTPDRLHHQVYKQGQHMVGYISERFGRSARNRWLRAMAQGKTLDEATREVMEMPFEHLDKQWRASLD